MAISADMVKKLREQTGAGMMDCKKALGETDGDFEKAITLLREKGIAIAQKRENRSASEGVIAAYVSPDGKAGTIVELNCETTFVAKTDEFKGLAEDLAKFISEQDSSISNISVDELMGMKMANGETVKENINAVVAKLGEKTALARFARVDTDGYLGHYIHTGDQIGVIVNLSCEDPSKPEISQLGRDLAMHIAWSNPNYLTREDISEEDLEKERNVHRQWAINEGKPEAVLDRIIEGKMKEFYSKTCLLEQPYIKDEDLSICKLIESVNKAAQDNVEIKSYVRFRVGETASDAE
ncbi:MAG: translation elongation factor Ts [Armatimonadota bacterium]